MDNMENTMMFKSAEGDATPKDILQEVYVALQQKGYDPINQIVGYLMSGDPVYITSHNGARSLIRKLERYELLDELVRAYLPENRNETKEAMD